MDHNLSELYHQLAQLAAKHGARKLILFGSRARNDFKQTSDIDLAIYGMSQDKQSLFWWEVEDLPTLLKLDLIFISPNVSPALLKNIKRDGVTLMDRTIDKCNKFKNALIRLEEALTEYAVSPSPLIRDGTIHRFELCSDLSWKATREYLIDQGHAEINTPKSVMRQAYADGLITDQAGWLKILADRNSTFRIYDDSAANDVLDRIRTVYLILFQSLCQNLND